MSDDAQTFRTVWAFPEVVPEEEDVHTDHDDDQRQHVERDDCLSAHHRATRGVTSELRQPGRRPATSSWWAT